jgi:hypothetical protein
MRTTTLTKVRTRFSSKQRRARNYRPLFETLENRLALATVFGITDTNVLVRFDSATPGTINTATPITGLVGGDTIQGIDFRPATGQLYGLGSGNRLYTINTTTGAASAPVINLSRDAARITRAVTTDNSGKTRDFILIEARRDVTAMIHSIAQDKSFERGTVGGLPVWQRPDLAIARIGPATLAIGTYGEVEELVQVRLGMQSDLKITGQLFDRFQALDRESALRLISRDPVELSRVFHPIFTRELLDSSQLLGLAVTLQNPMRARLLLKLQSPERATELARAIHDEPQRWLRLQDSDLLLYAQAPEIIRQDTNLELRFNIPEDSVRLLLQRIAKSDATPAVTTASQTATP